MGDISFHNKDIASKITAEALVGKTLAPFGFPDLKVVRLLPTNLPAVESNELRLDNLFELEDGSIAIIDYESVFTKTNFVKYLNYIARVLRRYANEKKLENVRKIRVLVIYTADVEWAQEVYDLGDMILNVESVYLVKQNSDAICERLEQRVYAGEVLTEEELAQLMLLPLTVKGEKQKYIEYAVNLAKKLLDRGQTVKAISGILTFTDKVINPAYAERIKEEVLMTKVGQLIFDEGWQKGEEKGRAEGKAEGRAEGKAEGGILRIIELVQKKSRKGRNLATIAEELETSEKEILPILECIIKYPDESKEKIFEYLTGKKS